jgi:hypothetical protein
MPLKSSGSSVQPFDAIWAMCGLGSGNIRNERVMTVYLIRIGRAVLHNRPFIVLEGSKCGNMTLLASTPPRN